MNLDPYEQVDGTPFTASVGDILQARGKPWRSGRNDVELNEMDYGDVVYRFQDNGRLEEITREAAVLSVGNLSIPFESLGEFVRSHDPDAFMRAGFVVSPLYGIAFDPKQPAWVTALARHCIVEWRAL